MSSPNCSVPSRVVATLLGTVALSRVRAALPADSLVRVSLVRDLIVIARSRPLSFVVTEPWDRAGTPVSPAIKWLKTAYPSVPVIAYCSQNGPSYHETVSLARAGIDGLIIRGIDDEPTALRGALDVAQRGCVQAVVIEAVKEIVHPDTAGFIEHCLIHAGPSLSIRRAASALGIDRKTLLNRLTQQRLPAPREIMAWCRVLVAARLLEDPGRSVEQVGFTMGCGSGTALRNLFVRHTGLTPSQVRAHGGMRHVLPMFATILSGRMDNNPFLATSQPRSREPRDRSAKLRTS